MMKIDQSVLLLSVKILRRPVLSFALLSLSSGSFGQTTVTYTGPASGLWNVPANWSTGFVPRNEGGSTFNVIIPAGKTVGMDILGLTEITGFRPEAGSRLNLFANQQMNVLGVSVISGTVAATGENSVFNSSSPFTVFSDGTARAYATGGASVTINAPSLVNTSSTAALFTADGFGSVLNLSSVTSITDNHSDSSVNSTVKNVTASNGGVINLSGLTTVAGSPGSNDWLTFNPKSGGTINLNGLSTISRYTRFIVEVPVLTLPSLQSASDTTFRTVTGTRLETPSLTSANNCVIQLDDGGRMDAPLLTSFTSSSLTLNPSRFWNAPAFTNFNSSRLVVQGGSELAVAATTFTNSVSGTTLWTADGSGSVLNLSSVTSITDNHSDSSVNSTVKNVTASNGGVINLSGLTTVAGSPGSNDWLTFNPKSGGTINLNGLSTISRYTRFIVEVPVLTLPSLQSASDTTFRTTIFNRTSVPSLTSANNCVIQLDDGGRMDAPLLTSFTSSSLTLNPSRFWNAPAFTNFNSSRLVVQGGSELAVAATTFTNSVSGTTLWTADGSGSVLNLSSVTSITDNHSDSSANSTVKNVTASNGGVINLSGLTTVTGSPGSNDWLIFRSLTGGKLKFGSLTFVGPNRYCRLQADTVDSEIEVTGSLYVQSPNRVELSLVPTIKIGGSFRFNHTDESLMSMNSGKWLFNGTGSQNLEVAGADLGLPEGTIAPNFHFGQITVGTAEQATIVRLVDEFNNGNRAADGKERLYIQGFPAEDGLLLRGGSTLVLNDFDAYAVINNEWVHLNALLGTEDRIPFDQGFIARNDAATVEQVLPSGYTVDLGEEFGGGLGSLLGSDDDRLEIFNDPSTLGVILRVSGEANATECSRLIFQYELSAARPGLSILSQLRNQQTASWVNITGSTVPTSDQLYEVELVTEPNRFLNGNGEIEARFTFQPINDEDPATDGWLHRVDLVKWTLAL